MSATRTLILGGGFGGIAAANALRRLAPAEHEIAVVDNTARFHVGAGKTWIMLGTRTYDQISQPRAALLDRGIRLVEADVTGIDLPNRTVATSVGAEAYDHLVIALGAELNPSKVPGFADAAQTFYTVVGAQRLKPILEAFPGGDVVILIPKGPFKCPPAPYEAAMLLHDAFQTKGLGAKARIAIHTAEGVPMATAGPEMGQYVKDELARRGIGFYPRRAMARIDGALRRVVFEDGQEISYDLLIGIPPHEAPKVVRDAGLTNDAGWVPVDAHTLRVKSRPDADDVYAIGDITALPLPGRYKPETPLSLPKAGVFAEAHGRAVAHQIAAKILSTAPLETFDGKGFCYLESGGERAVRADLAFFELPHPVMRKRPADEAQFRHKLDWVAEHLRVMR